MPTTECWTVAGIARQAVRPAVYAWNKTNYLFGRLLHCPDCMPKPAVVKPILKKSLWQLAKKHAPHIAIGAAAVTGIGIIGGLWYKLHQATQRLHTTANDLQQAQAIVQQNQTTINNLNDNAHQTTADLNQRDEELHQLRITVDTKAHELSEMNTQHATTLQEKEDAHLNAVNGLNNRIARLNEVLDETNQQKQAFLNELQELRNRTEQSANDRSDFFARGRQILNELKSGSENIESSLQKATKQLDSIISREKMQNPESVKTHIVNAERVFRGQMQELFGQFINRIENQPAEQNVQELTNQFNNTIQTSSNNLFKNLTEIVDEWDQLKQEKEKHEYENSLNFHGPSQEATAQVVQKLNR